jgi:hypothetical protein
MCWCTPEIRTPHCGKPNCVPPLVVTLGGKPVPDQKLGIMAFKDACLAASKTPPPQAGEWTLTAPDGRTWKADSPLKCCSQEQRERVPASVALARIVEEMERYDAEEAAKAASSQETGTVPHSCHCPARPFEPCPLTREQCADRATANTVACPKCNPL